MKIYRSLQEFHQLKNTYVSIGTFDGLHLGHRKILKQLIKEAKQDEAETLIISFYPHPKKIISSAEPPIGLIDTLEEKIEMLEEIGIDHLLLIPFTHEFSQLSYQEFVKQILVDKIGVKKLLIGYDHRFGKDRAGGFTELLEESIIHQFELEKISKEVAEDMTISSTKIRNALLVGNVGLANTFLGRPFRLSGKVIQGDQIGRTLGFPTANLFIEDESKLLPMEGIYAVKVEVNMMHHHGILYIGRRPTLNKQNKSIEVHIFDFNESIYDCWLRIDLIAFVREDRKFDSLESMIAQMNLDCAQALEILNFTK